MAVKWGLIGCGDIARKRIAPALLALPDCELVAVSRAQFAQAEAFAREFGARKWHEDWRELCADEELDAVYIATPVHLHAAQTIAAAEAGKHVLCEKPMALDVRECERMIAACRANHVKLGVAYYRHFYPVIARIKGLLAAGAIGQVVLAQINAFEWFNPPPDHPRRWLLEQEQSGGGPMFDFGCHRIEILLDLCGKITDTQSVLRKVLFERAVEDTGVGIFQFERGTLATLTVTHAAHEPQDTLDIYGSQGSLHVASLNEGKLQIKSSDGERFETHAPAPNIHQPLIADFVQAILDEREPLVNGETGLAVAQVEADIYRRPLTA